MQTCREPLETMLHDLTDMVGFPVHATDGEMGTIRNFLFDDVTWMTRYVVVNVGRWLNRQEVILEPAVLKPPDWADRILKVKYTREQIRNSPDVDTEKPVTRQHEIAMKAYYAGLNYWISAGVGEPPPLPPEAHYPVRSAEDPHLRSAVDLLNYDVWATDGEIGGLEGFVTGEVSWHIGLLIVKAGDWLHGRSVLIPTRLVSSISWATRKVHLQHTREGI